MSYLQGGNSAEKATNEGKKLLFKPAPTSLRSFNPSIIPYHEDFYTSKSMNEVKLTLEPSSLKIFNHKMSQREGNRTEWKYRVREIINYF